VTAGLASLIVGVWLGGFMACAGERCQFRADVFEGTGTWVGGIGTITALGFAFLVFRTEDRARRDELALSRLDAEKARDASRREEEERQRAMAAAVGLVASWQPNEDGGPTEPDGFMLVKVEILNASPYPLASAVLVLAADEIPKNIVFGTILPGVKIEDVYSARRLEVVFGELTAGVNLQFTDIHGNHWDRSTYGLERADQAARIC
jgi:hypothetical protein